MSMEEIKIIIAKHGKTTIDVNGIKGPSCTEVTKRLEAALGTAQERDHTDEYYEQEQGLDATQGCGGGGY